MANLIFLGTANAIPDEMHENTHLLLAGERRTVLVDCANDQILRLKKAGIDYGELTDLILTHFHPDHVSGVPQLIMNMWLLGHRKVLKIHALEHVMSRTKNMLDGYGWAEWPNMFSVEFNTIKEQELETVIECDEIIIRSSPVCHMIPAIGLRFELAQMGKVVAYSCDTEPCEQVVRLAANADILVHEASGKSLGHSSAYQAGSVAERAGVGALYLIHYPTSGLDLSRLIQEARMSFSNKVVIAEDMMVIDL